MLTTLKLATTGILVVISAIAGVARSSAISWLVFAALVFSWFGDAAMAYWKPLAKLVGNIDVFGIGAFALAHIMYIIAMVVYLRQASARPSSVIITLALFEIMGIVMWFVLAGTTNIDRKMKLATFFYMLLLVGMASLSVSAAKTDIARLWCVMVGGLLFVISDGLIAVNWFMQVPLAALPYLVWATYIPAQVCLLIGLNLIPVAQKTFSTVL
ncbi:MAG: lysoplasmalogenase [Oscillospiraceae bacterium]|jgi:uncharacterized membrane protein YhhN|nr:lysoplasmalogenase [Oscillospiraceae bacterium]